MNPLQAIPAKARKVLYAALTLAGVACGAVNIAGVDTGKTVDVLAYLGTAFGLIAVSNVHEDPPVED